MDRKRVVVTGMGLVTPAGCSVPEFLTSIYQGRSGIKKIIDFDTTKYRTQLAATVEGFDPGNLISEKEKGRLDRAAQMGIMAADLALKDAGLLTDDAIPDGDDMGVVVGMATGSVHAVEKIYHESFGQNGCYALGVPMAMCHSTAAHISIKFGLRGFTLTASTACTSGATAIAMAFRAIQAGDSSRVLAGGVDASITPSQLAIWDSLRVLSTCNHKPASAMKPFSRNRDGLVLGEGAALLVLEELESASARGARIYGEVVGFGSSSDGSHITRPSMHGEVLAMVRALKSADLSADRVDYINAHGTATAFNDKTETEAIKQVFTKGHVPVSSIKPITGHMLAASSAVEFAASLLAARDGLVPPTINYEEEDPACDLDYVPEGPRKADLQVVMSNSFGFGGHNLVLVGKRLEGGTYGIHA
ncbi:MAG: beta-ketoacyl-[acyl-carrier-protein] synthase family protein [Actinomycetota bacterium]